MTKLEMNLNTALQSNIQTHIPTNFGCNNKKTHLRTDSNRTTRYMLSSQSQVDKKVELRIFRYSSVSRTSDSWTKVARFKTHRHRRKIHCPNDIAIVQLAKESRPDWKTDDRLVEHQLEREREREREIFMTRIPSIYHHVWICTYSFVRAHK